MFQNLVISTRNTLVSVLNDSAISKDSIEGIIVIILIAALIYTATKRAVSLASWILGALVVIQFLYGLSQTPFNDIIPISNFIKYDILQSIAQLFVGTPICNALLMLDAFIRAGTSSLWDLFGSMFGQ